MPGPGKQTLTIAAVGDMMLQEKPVPDDVATVRGLLGGADISLINLDTVLSDQGVATAKSFALRGPREAAHDLRAMGFDLIAFANNHAMDFRAAGMLDSLRAFAEAGLLQAGAGENLAAATAPVIIDASGRRVAILSFSCLLPYEAAASENWPGIAPLKLHQTVTVNETLMMEQPGSVAEVRCRLDEHDLARVLRDVAAAREQAEIVLTVVHWGVPSPWRAPAHPMVQDHQRELGHALIEAGADAVLGNHAHELHGIEFYQGKPIAYCLGNFWITGISDYAWMGFESLVLNLIFGDSATPAVEIVPLFLNDDGHPRADPSARSINLLNRLSAEFGVTIAERDGRFFVSAER